MSPLAHPGPLHTLGATQVKHTKHTVRACPQTEPESAVACRTRNQLSMRHYVRIDNLLLQSSSTIGAIERARIVEFGNGVVMPPMGLSCTSAGRQNRARPEISRIDLLQLTVENLVRAHRLLFNLDALGGGRGEGLTAIHGVAVLPHNACVPTQD